MCVNLLKVDCCHLGSLLCVNTKARSSTEMVFTGSSTDLYKPVMYKWILKDYHQCKNTYERVRTYTHSAWPVSLGRTSLWEILPGLLCLRSD